MSINDRTMHVFSFQERNSGKWMYRAHGRIAGREILQVTPSDNAAGAYRIWYIPQLVPLTLTTSLDNIQEKRREFLEVTAAIRILQKAKRDTNALEGRRQQLLAELRTMANNRESEAEQGGTSDARYGNEMRGWPFGGFR